MSLSEDLDRLHAGEETLRKVALSLMAEDARLMHHLVVIERAMDLCDLLRQFETCDEDLKVVQVLGIRMFNAFGAALKLALSGYHQNGALVLRDVLETVFLLDLFRGDRPAISRWRTADARTRRQKFKPVDVRKKLDQRDGFTSGKRAALYGLFSELAGHPTMKSAWMLRPEKDGEAVIGPFMEKTALDAVLSEAGRLAVQSGEHLQAFFPAGWAAPARAAFQDAKAEWLATFYGDVIEASMRAEPGKPEAGD